MNPSEISKEDKRFSMAIPNKKECLVDINDNEKKERSLSSLITYHNWMVPNLKPKQSKIWPSPISLLGNTLNISKEQAINILTRDSDTSMSFDGEDFNLNIEESDKSDSDAMKDMRQMMTTIRSRAKSEYFSKDDETILTSKHIADEYSNLASKVLVPIVKMSSCNAINIKKTNDYSLSPLPQIKKSKRFSSIIEFLEDNYKTNSMSLPEHESD